MPNEISEALQALGELKLVDSYPYAAWVGAYLRRCRPDWWDRFAAAEPASAAFPLAQAADFAFLGFCEATPDLAADLALLLLRYFEEDASPVLRLELLNTSAWYSAQEGSLLS